VPFISSYTVDFTDTLLRGDALAFSGYELRGLPRGMSRTTPIRIGIHSVSIDSIECAIFQPDIDPFVLHEDRGVIWQAVKPSALAQDDRTALELWQRSAALAGISE
jgi:hypothetical protein